MGSKILAGPAEGFRGRLESSMSRLVGGSLGVFGVLWERGPLGEGVGNCGVWGEGIPPRRSEGEFPGSLLAIMMQIRIFLRINNVKLFW